MAYQHIDAATIHMVTDPGRFDVIVTDNLFGDIITDLAAAVCGGIGLAASGNIDATRTNPSMFEPVHGSAPDIAGQGLADPTAAVMSVALLLAHVGEDAAAARVDKAVEEHLATRGDASSPPPRSATGSPRPCSRREWRCTTDAFEMAIVHRVFRNELCNAPGLIREVGAGDSRAMPRSSAVISTSSRRRCTIITRPRTN